MAKKSLKPKIAPIESVETLLEHGTIRDLHKVIERMASLRKFHWYFYSELARQREEIKANIYKSLNESANLDFEFKNWQRAVKYKYSLHPLSALGSLGDPGGRFNIGAFNSNIPSFPSIYIAADKDTALQETLGQIKGKDMRLTPREIALTSNESESILSVSGLLKRVIDPRSTSCLKKFVSLIKAFQIPDDLRVQRDKLGLGDMGLITTPTQLRKILLMENWSHTPNLYDVPANSQIFGQLVSNAEIDGIVYNSKFTQKECLSIFPRNFQYSTSYIQLDHEPPDSRVRRKINSSNWRQAEMTAAEVFSLSDLN